jgi:hypothetical protein
MIFSMSLADSPSADIEAKEGDEFVVKASDISYPEPYSTSLYLKIDGQSVDGVSHCHFSPWNNTFAGYKVSQDAQILKCRAFTFGRMDLTSEIHGLQYLEAGADENCHS